MSRQLEILFGCVKYIKSEIVVSINGAPYDPTGDQVDWAFVAPGEDRDAASWTAGSWETAGTRHWVRILVGADVVLARGTYSVYVRITDDPEIPLEHVGRLEVE